MMFAQSNPTILDLHLTSDDPPDDLPRLGRGEDGVSGTTVMEQAEMGSMELDQVDNRGRRWRRFCVAGQEYHVNMSVLEPYLQVLSHGGETQLKLTVK